MLCLAMSCSKNNGGGVFTPEIDGEMTGKIDGQPFKAQEDGVAVALEKEGDDYSSLSVNAVGQDGSIIVAVIVNFDGAGTYQIVSGDNQHNYEAGIIYITADDEPVTYYTPESAGMHGSIQIQEFSRNKVRGKFSGTVYDPISKKNVQLTEMVFTTKSIIVTE